MRWERRDLAHKAPEQVDAFALIGRYEATVQDAERIIAAMLKAAQMAGGGAYVRVAAAVPREWLPGGEGAS